MGKHKYKQKCFLSDNFFLYKIKITILNNFYFQTKADEFNNINHSAFSNEFIKNNSNFNNFEFNKKKDKLFINISVLAIFN